MSNNKKPRNAKRSNTTRPVPRKGEAILHLTLSLEDNAYGFLNQSLKHYRKTARNLREWPFALLHLVQSLELLLKVALYNVHPILIFKDVDQVGPDKQTVTLEQALARLENLKEPIEEKERVMIRRASVRRNQVVHYRVDLNKFEWKKLYAQLFEFLHFFHFKHLGTDLHSRIEQDNWAVEARLMSFFQQNFVYYHGVDVHKLHARDIIAAQHLIGYSDGKKDYYRIKYGDEEFMFTGGFAKEGRPCHDCAVLKGQYHTDGCDLEECPVCHGQALGCPCTQKFKVEIFDKATR